MRRRIVVTQRAFPETLAVLRAVGSVIANEGREPWPQPVLLEHARDADALMVFMPDALDAAFLKQCRRLKIIAAALKGADNFDLHACHELGIKFTLVPDLLSEPTAELALALMLGLARNVLPGDGRVRGGTYQGWRPELYGTSLVGATAGCIGYGSVARALEGLVNGFRMRVIWHDPALSSSTSLAAVLAESDFVLPLVPLTDETVRLLDGAALARMRRGAYLVNVGRGSVVDEEAVADALASGQLGGYAADVFAMEDWLREDRPRTISPRLLAMNDKTLFTPHLGSATRAARKAIERSAAESILQVLA